MPASSGDSTILRTPSWTLASTSATLEPEKAKGIDPSVDAGEDGEPLRRRARKVSVLEAAAYAAFPRRRSSRWDTVPPRDRYLAAALRFSARCTDEAAARSSGSSASAPRCSSSVSVSRLGEPFFSESTARRRTAWFGSSFASA